MVSYGVVALNHDAALAVLEDKNLLFFKRASEYSGVHNDFFLNEEIVSDAFNLAKPDKIGFFENPYVKKYRQFISGQFNLALDIDLFPKVYLRRIGFSNVPIEYHGHHNSHVAYAKYSLNFEEAIYLVADAIGEMDTISIWSVRGDVFKKIKSIKYPISLGLFYSAFTKFIGMTPIKDEGKFMNLSLSGNPEPYKNLVLSYLYKNLHFGVKDIDPLNFNLENLAASVQEVFQEELLKLVYSCRSLSLELPIVFTGGCAHNKLSIDYVKKQVTNFYHVPDPGDATSSIGAAYLTYVKHKLV
jgi:carbamoyltransferase